MKNGTVKRIIVLFVAVMALAAFVQNASALIIQKAPVLIPHSSYPSHPSEPLKGATPPSAPTLYSATWNGYLFVEWDDKSNNEEGFVVQLNFKGKWVTIASTGANRTRCYIASGTLTAMSTYYRVVAFNKYGKTYSNSMQAVYMSYS